MSIGDWPAAQAETRQLSLDTLEEAARERLQRMVFDYYAGGAGDEWTLRENRRAFDRWMLRPRVLVDVSNVDLTTTVLGQQIPFPILIAPTALQRLAHPDGELATARAAANTGALMVVSTIASVRLEDIAETGVRRWFQLYVHKDRDLTAELVKRAQTAGYEAIVVTVDTPLLGRRMRDERNRFALPPGIGLANLHGIPLPQDPGSSLFRYFASQLDPAVTWEDIAWLRSLSPLPVVLKGVLTAEDAVRAVDAGVDGVVVSNHGGRQLDGVPAAIDVLPDVVDAIAGRVEVLMDSGVRRGTDVLKALALGARAVLVGRPVLWGLATGGQSGVTKVLETLREDLALSLALAGRSSVPEIDRSLVGAAPR
ncbi:MAG: alpha-hydroxy-acid oxidizing protein [Actinomycetota bacterium]|nr:alpha-hydroxy-acid oxidizing protein [Actinomycetota bacterium]